MAFWHKNVGQIIVANGFPLLSGAGTVRHDHMAQQVAEWYLGDDQQRKVHEAQADDVQDEAELKALEGKLKHRKGTGT